jgi:2',3'-cyclic-nucleotide 2'-phosphodiesterase (5'-nucleotidase family)
MRDKYGRNMLLLDSGSALSGKAGTIGTKSKGKAIIDAMNLIGYDAMTLGEQELRLGATVLRERLKEARFPIISANVIISETGQLLVQPYVVREIGGLRVAIVGLTEQLGVLPRVSGDKETLASRDPIEFGRPYVEKAAKESDVLIVLSHMGRAMDEALAAQVPAIDFIVGGRDKTLVHPARVDQNGPLVAQASIEGEVFGVAELTLDRAGAVTRFSAKLEALQDNYTDDAAMVSLLSKYR